VYYAVRVDKPSHCVALIEISMYGLVTVAKLKGAKVASSVRLSECIAEALGVPTATVLLQMRLVREAGILTQGSRGRNAPSMTAADAAHLLIAVAGTDQVRDSVQAVENFAGLRAGGPRPVSPIEGLKPGHTFGEALTALVQAFTDGTLEGAQGLLIDVEMVRPELSAEIEINFGGEQVRTTYRRASPRERDPPNSGDLKTITRFTRVTLQQVGEALRR
jgi:hypothetical protein